MQRIIPPHGRFGRRPHVIAPLKRSAGPSRIVTLDVSSAPEVIGSGMIGERLTTWAALACRVGQSQTTEYARGEGGTATEFWDWLARHLPAGTRTWLVAYRAIRAATLLHLWEMLTSGKAILSRRSGVVAGKNLVGIPVLRHDHRGEMSPDALSVLRTEACPPLEAVCIADPPTVLAIRLAAARGSLLLLDWRNWGHEGDALPSAPPHRAAVMAQWLLSAADDLKARGLGGLRSSPGGQALASWRFSCYTHPVHIHTYESALRLERQGYRGGRIECLRVGRVPGPVYQLDIRNSYASVMLTTSVPTVLEDITDDCDINDLFATPLLPVSIADCTVETDSPCYPVVAQLSVGHAPRVVRQPGRTCALSATTAVVYPTGRFRTVLPGPELHHAAAHGRIVRVHSIATYRCSPALSQFARRWLALTAAARERGDTLTAAWAKRVVVGLDGKLGEHGSVWREAPPDTQWPDYAQWTEITGDGRKLAHRNFAGAHQVCERGEESYTSVPSIAGWITSAARVRLWQLMELAGRHNVYYCDTDGILCNADGYTALLEAGEVRDGEPGYLRLQGVHGDCEILGLRHFRVGDRLTCSGLPKDSELAPDGRGSYWHRKTALQSLLEGHAPEATREWHSSMRARPYLHGVVGPDGSVTPHHLGR